MTRSKIDKKGKIYEIDILYPQLNDDEKLSMYFSLVADLTPKELKDAIKISKGMQR